MERIEKTLDIETIFQGKVITVERQQVALLPTNEAEIFSLNSSSPRVSMREIVRHPGGVCVVALNENNEVCLVRQYRKAMDDNLLELPAGKREKGEDPFATIQRELQEETGYTAKTWDFLGEMYATPGYCDEIIYLYLARDLVSGTQHLDEGEFLSVHWVPWDAIYAQILNNQIKDGKTKLAFLLAKEKMQANKS